MVNSDMAETIRDLYYPFMRQVKEYDDTLLSLGDWWQYITLIGRVNSQSLSTTLIEDMVASQSHFRALQVDLIDNLVEENVRKQKLDCDARAQVAIDVLNRNLFERTADVGFLAKDEDIRAFLREPSSSEEHRKIIIERLNEYTKKYSVYDEILLIDTQGRVRANLDQSNEIHQAKEEPLFRETLETSEPFIETFRYSSFQSDRKVSHIFSALIRDDYQHGSAPIGVLCLCFRIEDELKQIFDNLVSQDEVIALIDQNKQVIISSNERILPTGRKIYESGESGLFLLELESEDYLCHQNKAKGYQGYSGLDWRVIITRPAKKAFVQESSMDENIFDLKDSSIFSQRLLDITDQAETVVHELSLVVLNGKIVSAKCNAPEFIPVLEEIRNIGLLTQSVFKQSISDLRNSVVSSLLNDVEFRAFLAIDIMDRNLYERANDVRWWALNSYFRDAMAQKTQNHDDSVLCEQLKYINSLYTVYTNLILFDSNGVVLAVSNEEYSNLVGQKFPEEEPMRLALVDSGSQNYTVSNFAATSLYGGMHTYMYFSSICAPNDNKKIVGGICIVFDSTPEFQAMLHDALPRDDKQQIISGAFGVFTDRLGRIISSTHADLLPGERLPLEGGFLGLANGERASVVLQFKGEQYAVGAAMSKGYREYKTTGGYQNDVLALIFVPV